jgi:hypothetical protein
LRRFWWLMFLELVQNVPLLAGFIIAFQFWQRKEWALALACMAAGSVIAALVIWLTEPQIFEGHRETMRAVIGNVLTFFVLMIVLAFYLSASWSSWWTDIIVGVLLAVALAVAQEFAAKEQFGVVRAIWLAVSGAGTLLLLRLFLDRSLWVSILVVSIWFTLVMGLYKHLRLQSQETVPQ